MSYTPVAGVYEIRNTLNNKVYVGSSINVNRRMGVHRQRLSRGVHSSAHLQAAWNKHGGEHFCFRHLITCAEKDILFYEQRIMDGFNANLPASGYNKRVVVDTCAGTKLSAEHKAKIAASAPRGINHQYFGKRLSDKAYQVAADLKRGIPMPAEQRAKISASSKGVKKHAGFGAILSAARKGVRLSDEARKNMSVARIGMVLGKTHKENIGKLNYEKAGEIRVLYAAGAGSHEKLAARFGVSRKAIGNLLAGKTWT